MDIYDPVQVQAVWSRVMQPPQTAPDEETLLRWLAEERASAAAYRTLAARGGSFAPRLRHMAADELRHAGRLAALYFLLFGFRPQVFPAAADTDRSFGTALRSAYQGELAAAKNYRAAARRFPEQASMFESIAADEERHARMLWEMTAALMGRASPHRRRG